MSKLSLAVFIISFLISVSGCARLKWIHPSHENFKNVKTVKFVDNTDALVQATTTSKDFFPLLKIGFESVGIKVCGDCEPDAIVNIKFTHYGVISATSFGVLNQVATANIGQIRFYIDITKNGKSIYKRLAGTRSRSSLKITAAESISPIINAIAEVRKN